MLTRTLRAIPVPVADALLAALLILVDVVSLLLEPDCDCRGRMSQALWLSVAFGAALALRRRWPTLVWVLVGLAAVAWDVLTLPATAGAQFALMIALYTVAAHAPTPHVPVVAAVTLAGIIGTVWWVDGLIGGLAEMAFTATIFAAPLFLGDGVRSRRAAMEALEDRASRLEHEREEQARLAVGEERTRIARDLHDVVAHHLSVMVIQSEAAAAVVEDRPEARDRLEAIATTGRQALVEMRRVLGVLRQPDAVDRSPQPDLEGIARLVGDAGAAGMDVHLHHEGQALPVAAATAVSAHRIVQESLTNARRHAGPTARVDVTLSWGTGLLAVRIRDDGAGRPAGGDGAEQGLGSGLGLGLLGMRERATAAGGALDHGPLAVGGFEVLARLPLDPDSAEPPAVMRSASAPIAPDRAGT